MSNASQRRANRKNSQHSTGPTSEAGKSRSSLNSLKHGLASSQLIIPGESEEEFNTLLTGLLADHQPTSLTETLLVQDMAKHQWLKDRALRLQSTAVDRAYGDVEKIAPALAILMRYQTTNERAFHKCFATLAALRKAEIGSASQAAKQAAATAETEAKAAYAEWHAALLRHMAPPPTIEQMIAEGFTLNTETGDWEKEVPA